jgi:small subunit ribosomal protein S6e
MEVEGAESKKFIGLKIGEEFDAAPVGLAGYTLRITGGSDKNGFPTTSGFWDKKITG